MQFSVLVTRFAIYYAYCTGGPYAHPVHLKDEVCRRGRDIFVVVLNSSSTTLVRFCLHP